MRRSFGKKLAELDAASSITISVDDRAAFRLVRYRVDALLPEVRGNAEAPSRWQGPGVADSTSDQGTLRHYSFRDGILAVVTQHTRDAVLQDVDQDYSVAMKDSIVRAVRHVCTPLGGGCEQDRVEKSYERYEPFLPTVHPLFKRQVAY